MRISALLFGALILAACGGDSTSPPPSNPPINPPVEAPFGLDSRPSNLTCLAVFPPATADITLQRVFPDLLLDNLTVLTQPPNDSGVWYFATRDGLIGQFDNVADVSSFTTVLDHSSIVNVPSDGGLIQFIFHPNYPADNRVFVNYSVSPADSISTADTIVSSFQMSVDGLSINPQSENVLLRFPIGRFHMEEQSI